MEKWRASYRAAYECKSILLIYDDRMSAMLRSPETGEKRVFANKVSTVWVETFTEI